jgi:ribosome-associated protein
VTEAKPSKSAKKREYLALQKLGEELIGLREADIMALPLDEDLRAAVLDARSMKARGALRRQRQYIGKLMRHADAEPIRQALARVRR